ncbi:monooxygenase 3 [Rosa chinensis]|uniref:monooxygenase 3 n=1 Tax=Rosa chinensis TaxID=74649 RepID=UPI001AD90BA1|nr:monooxygenase 3 [Rosa chinensis]
MTFDDQKPGTSGLHSDRMSIVEVSVKKDCHFVLVTVAFVTYLEVTGNLNRVAFVASDKKELEKNPAQLKKYILRKLGKVQDEVRAVIENTELDAFISTPVRYRHPWELLWGNISKGGVCVAGDALHPMTPDIGQGGCAALEDGVVLARCLGEALLKNRRQEIRDKDEERKEECKRIEMGLRNYASKRKWRSIDLIITSYVFYLIQEIDGKVMSFLRNKFFSPILPWLLLKKADFDCGKLKSP